MVMPPGLQVPLGLQAAPPALAPAGSEAVIECPQGLVGLIIGRQGETIKKLQEQSGCSIQIDQRFPDGVPRKITIKGPPGKLELGKQLVNQIVNKNPPPPLPPGQAAAPSMGSAAMPDMSSFPGGMPQPASIPQLPSGIPRPPAAQGMPTGPAEIDPDVQEFCDHFGIDPRMTRLLNDELHKRPDTWEGDLLALWEIIEQARVPPGLLMVKIREMQNGTFVGKPKPDKEVETLCKKYKIDSTATQRLAEVLAKRDDRKGDLDKLEKHLRTSNKPSALVMMMLGKLRKGEDIGEPDHKAAPGSYEWEKDVNKEMGRDGEEDKPRDRDRGDRAE